MLATNLLAAAATGILTQTYIEDVFCCYVYTGTGSPLTLDFGFKPDMVHIKSRSAATDHAVYDSARGVTYDLATNSTAGQTTQSTGVTAFGATGITIGTLAKINTAGVTYVVWAYKEAPGFYKQSVVTKSAGSNLTVDLSSLGTVGMVRVKRIDAAGSWYVWHRSLPAGQLLIGETTAAAATLGHITVSGTTLTLVNGVIADGQYIIHAWAHDESADGLVQCGIFWADGGGNATVESGMEPQYVQEKRVDSTDDWMILDTARKWSITNPDRALFANVSSAEGDANRGYPSATGFAETRSALAGHVYLAIRRGPMRVPTDPTKVYNAIARTGTGAEIVVANDFPPDFLLSRIRGTGSTGFAVYDRLRGQAPVLYTPSTTSEASTYNTSVRFDVSAGVGFGPDSQLANTNYPNGTAFIHHLFHRAPGFLDEVCDTGTGAAHNIVHNLKSTPGMQWRKGRSGATQWELWHKALAATEKICLNSPAGKVTDTAAWNSTAPTDTVFSVGTGSTVNTNGATYVTYLFGDTAGLCKAFSYTGNGTNLDVILGFVARFIFLIRADAAGNAYLYDSVRGIVSGNDPYLLLNSTAAEVTNTDFIDPLSNGFNVAGSLLNINGATYIGWACA